MTQFTLMNVEINIVPIELEYIAEALTHETIRFWNRRDLFKAPRKKACYSTTNEPPSAVSPHC